MPMGVSQGDYGLLINQSEGVYYCSHIIMDNNRLLDYNTNISLGYNNLLLDYNNPIILSIIIIVHGLILIRVVLLFGLDRRFPLQ